MRRVLSFVFCFIDIMDPCFESKVHGVCLCNVIPADGLALVCLCAHAEASQQSGGERRLHFLPKCIYLKFEGATWQIDDLEVGVYPLMPSNNPWIVSEATKIKAKRRGFRIVPDFSATAHMMQGATLLAAIVDCLEAGHCSMPSEMLAVYIGLSRVRTKEALLIPQPFSPGLFCHGPPPGPEILMKVLHRELPADDADKDHREFTTRF